LGYGEIAAAVHIAIGSITKVLLNGLKEFRAVPGRAPVLWLHDHVAESRNQARKEIEVQCVVATSGSATLVYQVDWSSGVITISPVDITTVAGQNTLTTNLVMNTPVKVFGIPQADGTIKAYVLFYFTGFAQATTN
jgi:hypothetical protein